MTSLRFNNAKTELTAYVDYFPSPGAVPAQGSHHQPSKIVWNVANGSYTTTAKRIVSGPWYWANTRELTKVVGLSADEQFRARLTNPDMFGEFVAKQHVVWIDADVKLALMKAIIIADPKDEPQEDQNDNVSIRVAKAVGLGSMFGASLQEISQRKK